MKFIGKLIIRITIVLTLIVVITLIAFILYGRILPFLGKNFDQNEWLQLSASKGDLEQVEKDISCLKGKMVNDLKNNYLKYDITTAQEVKNLLGNDYSQVYKKDDCIEYSLGMCSGFKMDYDGLVICFDKNRKVRKVYTQQH